jgi:hypothetical protein
MQNESSSAGETQDSKFFTHPPQPGLPPSQIFWLPFWVRILKKKSLKKRPEKICKFEGPDPHHIFG